MAEVALALVLLVSAGLLFRSLSRLLAVDTGFDDAPLLTMQVQVTGHRYDADSVRYGFLEQSPRGRAPRAGRRRRRRSRASFR